MFYIYNTYGPWGDFIWIVYADFEFWEVEEMVDGLQSHTSLISSAFWLGADAEEV
jgi:hypothetical protein